MDPMLLTIMIFGTSFILAMFYREYSRTRMMVQEPWFTEIAENRKTVEGRVGNSQKHAHLVGKEILVHNGRLFGYASMICKVVAVYHYNTLEDYLETEGYRFCAPHSVSFEDATKKYLQVFDSSKKCQVFSPENILRNGGINSLCLQVIERNI